MTCPNCGEEMVKKTVGKRSHRYECPECGYAEKLKKNEVFKDAYETVMGRKSSGRTF